MDKNPKVTQIGGQPRMRGRKERKRLPRNLSKKLAKGARLQRNSEKIEKRNKKKKENSTRCGGERAREGTREKEEAKKRYRGWT